MWKSTPPPTAGGGLHPGLCNVRMADFLHTYLASGLAVRVWTVNEADDLRWLLAAGADVITNAPARALAVRAALQGGLNAAGGTPWKSSFFCWTLTAPSAAAAP